MNGMVRTVVLAVVSAVALGAGSGAQAQSNCSTYGYMALKQARENEQLRCGNTGPRWTTDLNAHIAWCNTVGPNEWRFELRERAKALASCRRK